ncbi:obscurin-like protein 1 isoform X8 [Sinocyclocheilus grahami]|uniref:obscurin-like protein 1 isoform X8 n=1 Tax=Sinocyclocheilus grahami TaxID=75366 RepID=UPI0007ACD2E2|nr:PREDICTED: obscurin-like protein 1 isoform X8 [Sinocyclocheilus grahami]
MDVFGGAPRFLAYPRPVVVQSGTDAVLKCQIGGDPRPAVIWERNNEKIHPEGRYRVFEDGNVYNLIITSVTMEDSGQYICKAKNCIGETYAAATLKVEGEAQEMEFREENKPRFLIKPLSTRVGRGEDAVFSCKLWGNPRPEVMWEKDGKKLNEIFESTHFAISYQDGGWFQLKIFKTRAPDGGVYTCKARNEFGESLAGAVLLVDAGPGHEDEGNRNGYTNGHWKAHQGKQRSGRQVATRLKDDPLPNSAKVKMFAVTEGKHAKFRCYVTGKPKPEILWRKDGRLILSGRRYLLYEDREGYFTLKVLYCKQQDNGVYVCSASNTAGQTLSAVHLFIKEPPVRFKQPLNDLQVWERDLAVLECEVPEDTVPITWYLEDRRLQPGAKYGMEEWGTKRRLTIRDIGVDDDGIYLCEMADGGRSIAEVAVKGTIVRKLPRKVDVLEGENAAFCVEVEEEEMDIHWYKDGTELRETHQTILKSFGRTHILVFVNTTPQDSGMVMFYVGRSKTSSQLRVKAARHCPPSCPIGVQINTERANAALLSWFPAQDSRKNPPSGYIIERQEVGSQEWLQCLTTDSATSVEILGDSVPCEADYRFRICSVNKYGRSGNVEFPRAVHLVPVARIQAPLQDALVPEGQDACFTIELSASVIGTWFLNGNQLQDDDRFSIRRSRTHQSLRIRGVRDTDNGSEITFIAYGIRDSAALYIQAPLVKFTPLSEMDRNKFVEVGNPIVLYCELSDPEAPVRWYKNGVELQSMEGLHIQSEGTMRRIVIQSADFSHSGVYSCDAIDDIIRFNVEVEAPLVRFSVLPEDERNKSIEAGSLIVLQCELSDPLAQVSWYKDGVKLLPQSGLDFKSKGTKRQLIVQSAEFYHSGVYSCKTRGDAVHFNVDVKAPPVRFSAVPEVKRRKCIEAGCPIVLQCEVSDSTAQVQWYKDGDQLLVESEVDFKSDDCMRTLSIQSAHPSHAGVYSCTTKDDVIKFHVEIRAPSVRFSAVPEAETNKCIEAGGHFELHCKLSDPTAQVSWFHNDTQLQPETGLDIQSEGDVRTLVVNPAEPSHSGLYRCESSDDSVQFTVDIKDPPVMFSALPDTVKNQLVEADYSTDLHGEISGPNANVCCYKDGVELVSKSQPHIKSECTRRTLAVKTAQPSNSGWYDCVRTGDAIQFNVQDQASRTNSTPVCGMDESIDADCSRVLLTEKSDHTIQEKLISCQEDETTVIFNKPTTQKELIQSSEMCLQEAYETVTKDEFVVHQEEVKEPCHKAEFFTLPPEDEVVRPTEGDSPVHCYKDRMQFYSENGHTLEESVRRLNVPVIGSGQSGVNNYKAKDDDIIFKVDVKATSLQTSSIHETDRSKSNDGTDIANFPQPEVSSTMAEVFWYKEGEELQECDIITRSKETFRALVVKTAEPSHSGEHACETDDVTVQFAYLPAPPVTFSSVPEAQRTICIESGRPFKLQCEVSDPDAQVWWYKDGNELLPQDGMVTVYEEAVRTLSVQSAELCHSGTYSCQTNNDAISFHVEIKAPPVTFAYIPEDDLHRNIVEQDNLLLCCQVSRSDATAQWYKDGVELKPSDNVLIEAENTIRRLIVLSAQLSDSGTYTCRAGDSALIFKVNVREPPVMIVYPKEDVHLDRYVPEEIVLSCELSRPNGKVTWFKDGQKLQESENIKLKSEGPYRRLKILRSGVEDSGEYVCDTADDSIFFNLNIKEPPVRIVSPSQSQMELCQQTSERMVLSCEISRPNATVRWYRDGLEVEESDSLILEVDGVYRRLIIPKPTVKDSAEYVCDTADDSVTFFVNIAEPPVRFIRPRKMAYGVEKLVGDIVVLECEVSRPNAEVSWKKDAEEIEENSNITITEDGTSRQLTIHSTAFEDAGQYICDARDDVMDFLVKIKDPPLKILRKADIETKRRFVVSDAIVLKCEISRPNGVVSWLKDNEKIEGNEHFICEEEVTFRSLIVLSAELKDSGEYICDAQDDKVVFSVTVEEAPVSIVGNSEKPEHHILKTGDELILECAVSQVNAIVQWYFNGRLLQEDSRTHIESRDTTRKLVISELQISDSGEYLCDAIDDKMTTRLTVQVPPFKFIKKDERTNISAYEEDSVTLRATVNRVNAPVIWQRGHDPVRGDRFHTTSDGNTHYLTINPLKRSDTGEYTCHVGSDEMHFSVHVKAMKVKFSKPLENVVGLKGSDVVLKCELYKSKGDVQWLKGSQEIAPNRHFTIRAEGRVRSLTIHDVTEEDAGEYACESKDERTSATVVVNIPRIVEFIAELHNITVMEGEDAIFKCVVSPEDAKLAWFKNGQPISSNEKFNISSNGLCHMLHINNCQVSDSCKLTAEAEGVISRAILQVQEAQVLFTKSMDPVVAEEFGEATLEVEVSLETAEVQWMRQGVVIHPGSKFTLKQNGQKRSLTIHKLTLSDRGTYSCETLHDRTQAKLTVEPRKIKIQKDLTEIQTYERETASFEVELSHGNVDGVWQKDGHILKNNNRLRMTAKGRVHSLTISNLTLDDTGTYIFYVENIRSLTRLEVKEIPVSILKKLEDIRQPEGSAVTLECELSRHNVDVKWTKNEVQLKPGKNHRIYSMGRKCFLQILKCELGDSGLYVCDAGDATTSCSVDIYERELEILQSLEDLDIQEGQNAVFMCEVSLDDVPREWFKNGEKIKSTSTIKIRQEGTKHFLLICNVKEDDSGEIKFVAKNVETTAYLEVEALPANIVKPLQDKTALEKTRVILDCTVTNPRCSIRWYKGPNVILPSERFEICSEGCYRKLVIQQVLLEDEGTYSVQVGNYTSSAKLTVEALSVLMVRELQDVDVTAPADACFECEVSLPVAKAPTWTLNGETLHPGPKVVVGKMGTIHRLILKQTSEDMSGTVCFITGRVKSTAHLQVISNH